MRLHTWTIVLFALFLSFSSRICQLEALSERGVSLLEELKGKVGKPSPAVVQPEPIPSEEPLNSAPPKLSEPVEPVVTPTPPQPEPPQRQTTWGQPRPQPVTESSPPGKKTPILEAVPEPKPEPVPVEKAKPAPVETEDRAFGKPYRPRKEKEPVQTGAMSDLIKTLKEKMEKPSPDKDHTPGSQVHESGRPKKPAPQKDRAQDDEMTLTPPAAPGSLYTPPAATHEYSLGYRSFGELSDEELIKYAQEHVWSSEKSRKHQPPWTPPYRPKSAKKSSDNDSSSKKTTTTDKNKTDKKPKKKKKSK